MTRTDEGVDVDIRDIDAELRQAAGVVAGARLADAFGHISIRSGDGILITPAVPLAEVARNGRALAVALHARELPEGVPREAWLPLVVAERDPAAGAIVRAQPRAVAAFASLGRPLPTLYGHAAMLGGVHVHARSIPARERAVAEEIVAEAGAASCIVLRGNGVVVRGEAIAHAVARLWVLEATADLALRAWAAGEPHQLPSDEAEWWAAHSADLLSRIYGHLANETTRKKGYHDDRAH